MNCSSYSILFPEPLFKQGLGKVAIMVVTTTERDLDDLQRVHTLGSVRLQKQGTKEIILIPTPSTDPNDPLNWYV